MILTQFEDHVVGVFQDSENCSYSRNILVAHILANIQSCLQLVDRDYTVCEPMMVYSRHKHV